MKTILGNTRGSLGRERTRRHGKRSLAHASLLGCLLWASACGGLGERRPNKATTCLGDEMACGRQCIAVLADATNCGGCGIPCSAGLIGRCVREYSEHDNHCRALPNIRKQRSQ